MAIEKTPAGTTITGNHIEMFRLRVLKSAVKLEAKGLKKRGKSATAIAKRQFGLSKGIKREVVIQRINEEINKLQRADSSSRDGRAE